MELKIVLEAGHLEAITGSRFSFQPECKLNDIKEVQYVTKKAKALAKLDKGHNKFLESIMVWVDIRASLKVWKQLDTYRLCTKQSKSTMHSIMKNYLSYKDFDAPINKYILLNLNDSIEQGNFTKVVDDLPSSYLQTRRVCLSYKTIRNIVQQRQTHRLPEWKQLCTFFLTKLKHPDLLGLTEKQE